ncbi:MAG: TonB-dependent receptor [Salinivirgaceae bacterium]|nr:TonB-dependent receptor [Salinivirgaceae bacterium]
MKKISLITVFTVLCFWVNAQFNLSGKIADAEGNALIGASVQIKGTFLGVSSNSFGMYTVSNLNAGTYQVVASYLGYETQVQKVQLENDLELNIKLETRSLMSDEVIVAASRAKENTPVAQTTLQKEDVERMNILGDIPYQLELTPSVVASSETGIGSGYSSMRIRGTSIYRINVTVNGMPLNDPESQGVYWVNMPDFTTSVNSIQIQRGVGTSTNGSAAFGASVNFQTLTIEPKPYANISSSIGSFNTFKENIAAGTGLINNKFAFDVRASRLNSDGYIKRGFSDHSSLYFSGSYYGEKDLLKAVVMLGKQKTGITWWGVPGDMIDSIRNFNPAGQYFDDDGNEQFYDGQTDNYLQNHYQLLYSREINKHLNVNASLHATTGKGYFEQYKYYNKNKEIDDYGEPTNYPLTDGYLAYGLGQIGLNSSTLQNGNQIYIFEDTIIKGSDIIRQKWLDNVFYGATASLNYHNNKIDATIGVAANNYDGDHFGKIKWVKFNTSIPQDFEWYRNTGSKAELSSFLKVQYSFTDDLSVFGDVQVRDIKYTMTGYDDDLVLLDQDNQWRFVNPKVGANYQINQKQRAYASLAISNREPARADLKEGLKEGGTKIPTHETLYDIELGYQIKHTDYVFGFNAYYMMYENQLVNTGELNSVGYPIMTNVKNSFRRGVELVGGIQLIKKFSWNGNLTLAQNRILNYVEYAEHYDDNWAKTIEGNDLGETDISYSPEVIAASQLRFEPIKNVGISWISKYVGEQYFDNTSNNARKLDAYMVNNLGFDYAYRFSNGPELSFQFLVNNILDTDYISNAYGGNWYEQGVENTWAYYFPQAGRNFMFKTVLRF